MNYPHNLNLGKLIASDDNAVRDLLVDLVRKSAGHCIFRRMTAGPSRERLDVDALQREYERLRRDLNLVDD